jgi:hypothetical protein
MKKGSLPEPPGFQRSGRENLNLRPPAPHAPTQVLTCNSLTYSALPEKPNYPHGFMRVSHRGGRGLKSLLPFTFAAQPCDTVMISMGLFAPSGDQSPCGRLWAAAERFYTVWADERPLRRWSLYVPERTLSDIRPSNPSRMFAVDRTFGPRLRREPYECYNPIGDEGARDMGVELALALRERATVAAAKTFPGFPSFYLTSARRNVGVPDFVPSRMYAG